MMLLEHDAKELLAQLGLPVPAGVLATQVADVTLSPPLVVKAQVPVGGRGKAGGIKLVADVAARDAAIRNILGINIKGHPVRAVRLEQPVTFVAEAYVSFTIDPAAANVRLLMNAAGGVDVEDAAAQATLCSEAADLDEASLRAAVDRAAAQMPANLQKPLREAGYALAKAFLALEAVLLEINPLFVRADGSWVIGDTKLVADDNALERCDAVRKRIEMNPQLYPQESLKMAQGYDFVRLDADGDIGLVTTGAGLSMQLVDELTARGHRPYNFCDIRTGMFRGDPGRLIQVFRWIAEGPKIRAVLINFFAGLTDLGEIARLLLVALKEVPELNVPITARLIGNNAEEAKRIIAGAGSPMHVYSDLEEALSVLSKSAQA